MNTVRKNIVLVLAAFGIAGASLGVQAQTAAPQEGRHGHAMSKEARQAKRAEFRNLTPEQRQAKMAEFKAKRAEHRAARQARLAESLKLTPAQQPAWQAFVASMTPQQGERQGQRLTKEQRTAPQRLERRIAMEKQRTARMEARLSALNSLYATLTPEQRKVLDEQQQGRRGGRHHRGHGMMHG